MSGVAQPVYQLAAGYNNAAGLTTIEGLTPPGDVPFERFRVWGSYAPGTTRMRGDGLEYYSGYPNQTWFFGVMTRLQLRYLQETYCNSAYSGKVTLRTTTDDPDTLANYNAIMLLTKLSETETLFRYYPSYSVRFTRMVAL